MGGPGATRRAAPPSRPLQGGADYTTRFSLAERDGGTDLTLTFGADVVKPTAAQQDRHGPVRQDRHEHARRKALAKDLAEIAAKAESL